MLNKKKDRFVYQRALDGRSYIIDCNLGKKPHAAYRTEGCECIFTTGEMEGPLGAYEARIWKKK